MNTPTQSKKGIIIVIAIAVIAAIGYFYYSGKAPATGGVTVQPVGQNGQPIGTDIIMLLNQISSLKIDTSIFNDPAYLSLHDYTVVIPPVPVGRPNPFAPLPGVPLSGTAAAKTAGH